MASSPAPATSSSASAVPVRRWRIRTGTLSRRAGAWKRRCWPLGEFDFALDSLARNGAIGLIAVEAKVAVVEGVQRAKIPVSINGSWRWSPARISWLDLRKVTVAVRCCSLPRCGSQHADLTHADAVTRRPAGAGIAAERAPSLFVQRKSLAGAASRA